MAKILGIDVGGSAVKGAVVDIKKGILTTERIRIPTSNCPKPKKIAEIIKEIKTRLNYSGLIGIGFPAIIKKGVAFSAANINDKWIGTDVNALVSKYTGENVFTINDADSAGIAEMKFGKGKEFINDIVIILTLGTGIGSAVFVRGELFPNTELGHLILRGKSAEKRVSEAVRIKKELGWKKWAERFQEYLSQLEFLFSPDVIIFGGGGSKHFNKFSDLLNSDAALYPAKFLNRAGIIGATLFAEKESRKNTIFKI